MRVCITKGTKSRCEEELNDAYGSKLTFQCQRVASDEECLRRIADGEADITVVGGALGLKQDIVACRPSAPFPFCLALHSTWLLALVVHGMCLWRDVPPPSAAGPHPTVVLGTASPTPLLCWERPPPPPCYAGNNLPHPSAVQGTVPLTFSTLPSTHCCAETAVTETSPPHCCARNSALSMPSTLPSPHRSVQGTSSSSPMRCTTLQPMLRKA